jgi:hypothetical protein
MCDDDESREVGSGAEQQACLILFLVSVQSISGTHSIHRLVVILPVVLQG